MPVEDRRRQILSAAEACFARHGFHQASMQEICKEADLSPGSVYRYFRSKDELIAALIDDNWEQTSRLFAAAREEADVVAALVRMANEVLRDIDNPVIGPLHFECTAESVRNPKVAAQVRQADAKAVTELTELLRRGQATGRVDASLDPATTARTLIALIDGLAWRKFVDPTTDLATFLDTIRTLLDRFLNPL
jgi:TetR/AcrR family transcriptional regulator, repressor for uid operon